VLGVVAARLWEPDTLDRLGGLPTPLIGSIEETANFWPRSGCLRRRSPPTRLLFVTWSTVAVSAWPDRLECSHRRGLVVELIVVL
jgi:hypothetical protein